jgi:MFS transporter, ACS family, hexuronate transporter
MAFSTSSYRWWILTLLTLGTIINYLDRIALAILIPVIRQDLDLDERKYGWVVDTYGTRIGYTITGVWWSIAGIVTSIARTPWDLGFYRAMLGLGESGNFPSAIKAVAEWFPAKDRAFATGIFNAGTNVATMIGPAMFVAMKDAYGWRACFWITGAMGLVWSVIWWFSYYVPKPESVGPSENTAVNDQPMPWKEAIRHRQTWGFALAKAFSDPVWWFLLFWLPLYLYNVRKLDMNQVKWILPFIYLVADIGSVAGGWLSGYFLRLGWSVPKARKTTLFIFACLPPIAATAVLADNLYIAVGLFSLATAAHQGWSRTCTPRPRMSSPNARSAR